jgi:hypothetical protein
MARDREAEPAHCCRVAVRRARAGRTRQARVVRVGRPPFVGSGYPACMTTGTDALFCSVCSGYVHPFLEACPTCGAPHASRYDEALRGEALGLASLPGDPDLRSKAVLRARNNTLVTNRRFPMMSGGPEVETDEQADLPELLNEVTGAFQYRMWLPAVEGAGPDAGASPGPRMGSDPMARRPEPFEARLMTEDDRLLVKPMSGHEPIEFALATVRSVGTVRGTPGIPATQPPRGAEVVLTAATPEGMRLLCIGNPGSLFATKARSDHFGILAWWLGVVAGVSAERRWMALGPARHAVELGLRVGTSDEPVEGTTGPAGTDALGPAIEALDRLRDAGVLTPTEYEAKLRDLRSRVTATRSPRDRA